MGDKNLARMAWNLCMRLIVFEILSKTLLKCSLKFSFFSKIEPRYFWDSVWLTWRLLKVRLGWASLSSFLLKITSCGCSVRSELNVIFLWQAHLLIFLRPLLSSSVLAAVSRTTEKSDTSSGNNFALVIRPSGRS